MSFEKSMMLPQYLLVKATMLCFHQDCANTRFQISEEEQMLDAVSANASACPVAELIPRIQALWQEEEDFDAAHPGLWRTDFDQWQAKHREIADRRERLEQKALLLRATSWRGLQAQVPLIRQCLDQVGGAIYTNEFVGAEYLAMARTGIVSVGEGAAAISDAPVEYVSQSPWIDEHKLVA